MFEKRASGLILKSGSLSPGHRVPHLCSYPLTPFEC